MYGQTHRRGQRFSPFQQFKPLHMGHVFQVSSGHHLAFPDSEFIFGLCQGPPCVHVHLLAKIDSIKDVYGQTDITYYGVVPLSLFDRKGDFLLVCSKEDLLDFENKEYVAFYLLSQKGLTSPIHCYFEYLSIGNKLQLYSLRPIYLATTLSEKKVNSL